MNRSVLSKNHKELMKQEQIVSEYVLDHSSEIAPVLKWLERETYLRTNCARMLSGAVVGQFLSMITRMCNPQNILELGTFTGYSALCFALAMRENAHLDTIERNDELEDLILEGFNRAGVTDRVTLHIGDAKKIISSLDRIYDIVYIDANKREYSDYYELVFDKVSSGGYIIADNVLWDGKVFDPESNTDSQTMSIMKFNKMIKQDRRVESFILPIRDGLNIIRKIE